MQIKSFLLPIMMATTVSISACSSKEEDATQSMTDTKMDMSAHEMKKEEAPLPTVFDTAELQLSYYIGYNVSSSILASDSFDLDLEQAKQGIRDGSNSVESAVSQAELEAADQILRAHFEAQAAAQSTDTDTQTATMVEIEPTAEFLQAQLQLSYYIGYNISSSVIASDSFAFDASSSIVGLIDGAEGSESKVTPEQLEAADAELRARFEAKQAALNEEQMKAQAVAQKLAME